jgi:hypothetical protein
MVDIPDTKVFAFKPFVCKIQTMVLLVKTEVYGTLLIF